MKVLIIKTSSLGDVVHALPAVTEALRHNPALEFDWVVERAFAGIPACHPGVRRVIPVEIRRWRRHPFADRVEMFAGLAAVRKAHYDLVIDAQGLFKSALLSWLARGNTFGFDRASAREGWISRFYTQSAMVQQGQHAITRQKQLFAAALGYAPDEEQDFGLSVPVPVRQQIMLLHGTTWKSKEWPQQSWQALADIIRQSGYDIVVPAGNPEELARAMSLTEAGGRVLDRLPLDQLMSTLAGCAGVVSVDTGLGHLAPALGVPAVGLFGATSPLLTGISGKRVTLLASAHLPCIPCKKRVCRYPIPADSSIIYPPCFEQITPETVWQALQRQIGSSTRHLA